MDKQTDVVIIGGGQAGLSVSYSLTQQGRPHLIVEKSSSLFPAWRSRWDSFTLVTPNWFVQLPGKPYEGSDPDGFLSKREIVDYFENFVASFKPEVRFETQVTSIEKNKGGDGFLIRAGDNTILADNVVVATGTFQTPRVPSFATALSRDLFQIHTNDYRNPESLPSGNALVVGSSQSGGQIAEELYQSGRKVYLSVGRAPGVPRRYRGKDMVFWMHELGLFDQSLDKLKSSRDRFAPNPRISGKGGGRTLSLHRFAREGVVLLGHLEGVRDKTAFFAPDLKENLAKEEQFATEMKEAVDKLILEKHLDAAQEDGQPEMRDGYDATVINNLDLDKAGVQTVVWATGYSFDFSWIKFPIFDDDHYPMQERGVSSIPGLYFVGLHWMHTRKSGLLYGVGQDAAHVAAHLAKFRGARPA